MAINVTTLSGAITATQTSFGVASATGITAPNNQTGSGITFLLIENELMLVAAAPNGTTLPVVVRGVGGTQAAAHAITAPVVAGLPTDFPLFVPAQGAFAVLPPFGYQGFSAPVASATTITPTGPFFHVTGTTATATINLPANFTEGQITVVADGVWTWTAAGNIAVAGTVTTAGSSVTFTFDQGSGKWHPSRLA